MLAVVLLPMYRLCAPLSIVQRPVVGPFSALPLTWTVWANRPMEIFPAFAVPMLIGVRPEALPKLMPVTLPVPLSIANAPAVGPVIDAPSTESGPPIVVVVPARPMVTVLAFAVPMLIGVRPELLPIVIPEMLPVPLSMKKVPLSGPVILPAWLTANFEKPLTCRLIRLPLYGV